jgi:uncharacterized protein YbjT (DUF2867 family)
MSPHSTTDRTEQRLILLTGATGYVGSHLLPLLVSAGERVRCLTRQSNPRLPDGVEYATGNVLEPGALRPALQGVHTAYYLIHSMGSRGDFEAEDRRAAQNFADAVRVAGVRRIIYLGGLAHGADLSPHLASRQEVGRILRDSPVPTIEFRASIIIGSGSLSYEMIRTLVDRLPVMITPRWVRTLAQPIGIDDVLAYLRAALDVVVQRSAVFEIGGADRASYKDIMLEYARQRGLRRILIPVPVLTPSLSSYWLGLVTPLYARIGRKLIEGVRNPSLVRDQTALRTFPIRPIGLAEQIQRALSASTEGTEQDRSPTHRPLSSTDPPGR